MVSRNEGDLELVVDQVADRLEADPAAIFELVSRLA